MSTRSDAADRSPPLAYSPIIPRFPRILHGGDYNPDQWRDTPEIWDEDMRLMKLALCNTMSVGIFAWSALEPEEGRYEFGWLDQIMDKLAAAGAYAVLATPSGARPAWMSAKYPEVLRVRPDRGRNLHGTRHNHCYTSPVYREKCVAINTALAERYRSHAALGVWHVSNEYGGECHCPLCQDAFRSWLRRRYGDDLDALNRAWWTDFWSHRYTEWSQVESPSPIGEHFVHGHNLDWKRFVTDQTVDFFRAESAPLRSITPKVPITINMMGTYTGLDYRRFADQVDVISWDSYPSWGTNEKSAADLASDVAFTHDLNRTLKDGKPWMLMESTPSNVNWQGVCKLKPAGLHLAASLQAVAHGADTVQYFQWRKSRGSSEKFHGAVVDHEGSERPRVFREVAELGAVLAHLDPVVGSTVRPEVALIYDWDNRWAIDDLQGLRKENRDYEKTCKDHYRQFRRRGISVDVIAPEQDISRYRVLVAPMLYMIKPGVAERIAAFVRGGGTLVTTYVTGYVNESDLCFLGGFPGGAGSPLRQTIGVWAEEIDALYDTDRNSLRPTAASPGGNGLAGLRGPYDVFHFCELIHAETAEVLATYGADWYAGRPCLTRNRYGDGLAYHIAARTGNDFLEDFYGSLLSAAGIEGALGPGTFVPPDVLVQERTNGDDRFIFVSNFSTENRTVPLGSVRYTDLTNGAPVEGNLLLGRYGCAVLRPRR